MILKFIASILSLFVLSSIGFNIHAQTVLLKAYTYESGNRGYLNQVHILITDAITNEAIVEAYSNPDGQTDIELPVNRNFKLIASKNLFKPTEVLINTKEREGNRTIFHKIEMKRAPGYLFEITLAEKRDTDNIPVSAIKGALIEVYNNTTKKQELILANHPNPEFQVMLLKNNHYTILIRKEGYLAKRMEAFVNIEGCILCFEGVGKVEPGVSENLTEGNQIGTLLANVEMEPLFKGKKIELQNIYYDYNKWDIREDAKKELKKVAEFLKDNPRLNVELGSHTDARGEKNFNLSLSKNRATAATNYLVYQGGINKKRISSKGYGESQIINHCVDGVECDDEVHERNRRTELKILDIEENFIRKSLVEMKKEADLEILIEELTNQEIIKVEDGEELPEDLKEAIFDKDSLNIDNSIETEIQDFVEETEIMVKVVEGDDEKLVKPKFENYTGFKIAAVVTKDELSKTHKIYQQFENNHVWTEQGLRYYLIGDFSRRLEAQEYLNKVIKMGYSKARLLGFQNGERVE